MKLIKKLQECSTIGQADPILTKLGAGPAVKKLVETAIILSNSQDPQQRSHAFQFMESAIKEMEDDKLEEMGDHSDEDNLDNKKMDEIEDDDDKPVHEEVLDNNNNGPREVGSEGSTENKEPFPQVSGTEPDAEGMNSSTGENQWNETNGNGMIVPGIPPYQNEMGHPGGMPGLSPDIAQEMGQGVKIPPMNTNQMMKQMQYTVNQVVSNLYKKEIAPLHRIIKHQKEVQKQQKDAIKSLSQEIRETKNASGNMKLDLDYMRKNKTASFRETESPISISDSRVLGQPMSGIQPQSRKKFELDDARAEIATMDKLLTKNNNPYQ